MRCHAAVEVIGPQCMLGVVNTVGGDHYELNCAAPYECFTRIASLIRAMDLHLEGSIICPEEAFLVNNMSTKDIPSAKVLSRFGASYREIKLDDQRLPKISRVAS